MIDRSKFNEYVQHSARDLRTGSEVWAQLAQAEAMMCQAQALSDIAKQLEKLNTSAERLARSRPR